MTLSFSFAVLWKYFISATPPMPLGQDFIFHLFCLLPLYVLMNATVYWLTKSVFVEQEHIFLFADFCSHSHPPTTPFLIQHQRDLCPPSGTRLLPSPKLSSDFPSLLLEFQIGSVVLKIQSDLLTWLFLSPWPLAFQFLKLVPVWGLLRLFFFTHEKNLHTSVPFSLLRSQLKCHLFLSTRAKQPSHHLVTQHCISSS